MGTTERVVLYIEYKGISKYKFCKDLGFSNKFLDNSSNMGTDKACKILHYFPEIDAEWLLTGKGKMLKKDIEASISTITENNLDYKELAEARLEIIVAKDEIITMLREKIVGLEGLNNENKSGGGVSEPSMEPPKEKFRALNEL